MSLKKSKRPPRKRRGSAPRRRKKWSRKEIVLRGIFVLGMGVVMGLIAVNIVAHLWLEEWTGYDTWSLLSSVAFLVCLIFLLCVADT